MNLFEYLADPTAWGPEFAAQLGLTVAIAVLGGFLGLVLGRLVRLRQLPRNLRWLTQVTPALALVLIPATLLGSEVLSGTVPWWLLVALGGLWLLPITWTATARELPAEQMLVAEALDVPRATRVIMQRHGLRHRVGRSLLFGWRAALTLTTGYGILATATEEPTAATGLGGLIAAGVRDSNYPLAFAGALGLLVLGLLGETLGLLRRPQPNEGHDDELAH